MLNYCDLPLGKHFQDNSTSISLSLNDLHDRIMFIMFIILTFTLFLVLTSFNFNYRIPRLYINDTLEFGWIFIPVIILYSIAIYSIDLMYSMDEIYDPELTLGITGYQWYWGYNYPDYNIEIESRIATIFDTAKMIQDFPAIHSDLKVPIRLRNIETDEAVVLPSDTNIRLIITSSDVIHSWAVPSLGVKLDAIPGRINSIGINIHREGIFYGQCSELCGILHGFMPIKIVCVNPYLFLNEI